MTNAKTVRVGKMPGAINEFAIEVGQPLSALLSLAGLDSSGFEVKVDGVKVTDLNTPVTDSTNLVILSKMVKGNAVVRIGKMPGAINEFAVEDGATFASALALAGLSADGFEVKADGTKITNLDSPVGSTNLIILSKMVKGNGVVRIGKMPGAINEFAVEDGATFASALSLAGLSADGFEVKADGTKITDLNSPVGSTNLIILSKMVKGNEDETIELYIKGNLK